jgi:phospho-N-acetylmuramoyl-pentapeptide-transferase
MLLMLFTTLWLGLLGFLDDYLKGHSKQYDRMPGLLKAISEFSGASLQYREKNKNGMRPIVKLLGQALLGLGVGLTLWLAPDSVMREGGHLIKSTLTTLPFVKSHNLDYAGFFGFLGNWQQAAGWIFFVCVTTFIIMAVSNGSNLDDGMDGLCAGNSAIMSVALVILAYFSSHAGFADYFNIMNIPGCQELVVFGAAFIGALIGFLWYNAYPAQIFMGDTGSLPIGGIIAVMAVIIRKELLLPIICFIFLIESISVLGQNYVARKGNAIGKKYRFVNRAPIHDAFRLKPEQLTQLRQMDKILLKWPKSSFHENKVTARFWIVTIILASFAIMTLKVR